MAKIAFIADEGSGQVRTTLVPVDRPGKIHTRSLGRTFTVLFFIAVAELVYLILR
jgi:hypothetical protein